MKTKNTTLFVILKIVLVGDGPCGKSSLIIVFVKGIFPLFSCLIIYNNYVVDAMVDGERVELGLWDTCGIEEFDRIRPLLYLDIYVILICFVIDNPDSLENWISEGEEVRKKIEAYKYLECSARTNEGVIEIFEEAARVLLLVKVKEKKKGKKTGVIRHLLSR
ncbi:P-loop containing nucleoside triphosphate hydrolase protein [Leptodontidium sp. 2 PMI_412]|nr:P-loop containing nucleoside triphosphate hydrolase protein [Leptodontidium sp. 2 PMI_412]